MNARWTWGVMGEFKVGIGSEGERPGPQRAWLWIQAVEWLAGLRGGWHRRPWIPTHLGQYAITYVIVTTCGSPKVSMPATPLMPSDKVMQGRNREWRGNATWVLDMMGEWMKGEHGAWWVNECKVYVLNVECDGTSYPHLIVLALFPKGSTPPPGINHKNPVWNTGDKLIAIIY